MEMLAVNIHPGWENANLQSGFLPPLTLFIGQLGPSVLAPGNSLNNAPEPTTAGPARSHSQMS